MEPETSDAAAVARAYWKAQLVLALVVAVTVVLALALVALSASARPEIFPQYEQLEEGIGVAKETAPIWPAVLGTAALGVTLVALVVHAARVAAFTFRRGDIS